MSEWKRSPCKGCGEPMIWARTSNGKNMPLDAEPVSRALVGQKAILFEIREGDDGKPECSVSCVPEGHVSHWVTCEKRDDFRKKEA